MKKKHYESPKIEIVKVESWKSSVTRSGMGNCKITYVGK